MSKTRGTSRLPLPESIDTAMKTLGYHDVTDPEDGIYLFRHPKHRELYVRVVPSNIAGSADVLAEWNGQPALRVSIETLIANLKAAVQAAGSANRVRS